MTKLRWTVGAKKLNCYGPLNNEANLMTNLCCDAFAENKVKKNIIQF